MSTFIFIDENSSNLSTPVHHSEDTSKEILKSPSSLATVDLASHEYQRRGIVASSPIQMEYSVFRTPQEVDISCNISCFSPALSSVLTTDEIADSCPPTACAEVADSTQIQPDTQLFLDDDAPSVQTEEDRIQREIAESEALAWEMMRQENLEAHRIQMQFIRENAEHLSPEDILMMESIMAESGDSNALDDPAAQEGDDNSNNNDQEEVANPDRSDPDDWDYDRLLALGQMIGDVKTDRWRTRAQGIIDQLPKMTFSDISLKFVHAVDTKNNITESSTSRESDAPIDSLHECKRLRDDRCNICIESLVSADMLAVLPCEHYFHEACTQQWLLDHNSCPVCKTRIVATP